MRKQITIHFFVVMLCLSVTNLFAQKTTFLWTPVNEASIPVTGVRYIVPNNAKTFHLDLATLKVVLQQAPVNGLEALYSSYFMLDIPLPDGSFETFRLSETPMMEQPLANMFPEIKTYSGVGTHNGGRYLKMDVTPQGFHAMILTAGEGTMFIDPYYFGGLNAEEYIVYYKKDFASSVSKIFNCGVDNSSQGNQSPNGFSNPVQPMALGTCQLKTYRLALAATGEYTAFHGGTVALAQAAQVTTMNRVNGVYEREEAVHMNIVGMNANIVFTNSATDPYTNGTPGTMITQNQTTCDNATYIGSANYDIGHVFGTNSGGLAGLGVVCTAGQKARGVTGSAAPIGDPFDIDYVAHEMGHEFGCNHTFHSNANACNGNMNNATSMEPGSGSTIMGYAGICSPQDLQSNSDDYFHGISLEEMANEIASAGHTCEVTTALTNNAPTISTVAASYSIPANTPFFLTASATDPDVTNVLTYCWEQMNGGTLVTMPPVGTNTSGPNFRSWDPTTSPTRYFPRLADLAANTVSQWEVLPTVTRTMNFRLVVRDNAAGGGCNDHEDFTVSTVGTAGPFAITYPTATGITWAAGSSQTVTWSVNNTNVAPISCANVDILLSTDGGVTFPITLATNTPNDGTQTITVPNNPSTTCRVMVRAVGNIFFDISNNNFTITAPSSDYSLSAASSTLTLCPPTSGSYTINVGSIGGYTSAVTLSLTGLPAGATSGFTVNPVTPGNSTTLNINPGSAVAGTYNLTLQGNSAAGVHTIPLTLTIASPTPGVVTVISPANGATNQSTTPAFTWNAISGTGITYDIDISTSASFTPIVNSATGLTTNSYTPGSALASGTTFYWRVRAVSPCGNGAYSTTRSFTTGSITCTTYTSTNVPVAISATGTPLVTSTLVIPANGTITDVNVVNLNGTHTYISDLIFRLKSPANTTIRLFGPVCTSEDNWGLNLDDEATPGALPCPPVGGGNYQPLQALTAFDGQNLNGTWTLSIRDTADQDGGSLTGWGLNVCYISIPVCSLTVGTTPTSSTCGNNNGSAVANAANSTGTVSYTWSNGANTQTASNLAPGTYTVTISDASTCTASATAVISATADATNPVANCQNATIYLNGSGNATLNASQVNNGSTDNCTIATTSVSPNTFACTDVTFTNAPKMFISEYTEGSGSNRCVEIANFTGAAVNLSGYQLKVYLNGSTTPTTINLTGTVANGDVYVVCNNAAAAGFLAQADQTTANLNHTGNDAIALFGPSNDTLDIFGKIGCDPGATLGWTSGAYQTVNRTLVRNADIAYGINHNPGGTCTATSFPTLSTQWTNFAQDNLANLGSHTFNTLNPVTLTVTDGAGNTATCTAQVTVLDTIRPTITAPANISMAPNSGCNAINVTLGNPVTSDNCGVWSVTNNAPATFPSGTTTVTWTVTDKNGNTKTATQTVTVTDNVAPVPTVASLSTATGQCSVTLTAPTATDNCSGALTGTTASPTSYTAQGTYTVVWTYTDGSGNTATQSQTIIVDDTTPPVTPSLTNVTGQCSVTPTAPTTTDVCAGSVTGTTSTTFPITTQGTTVVTWTFNDGNGNTTTANQTIIIDDTTPPVTPALANVTGQCSVTPAAPTTTDACAGTITGTTSATFPITTQGTTVVTWTFNDGNGNTTTANQNVIVDDTTPPVVPTLADVHGSCSATATAPTTNDACAGAITGTTTTTFPVTSTTVVTWTFNDGNGNTSTATQNVIVDDNTPPVAPTLSDINASCSATPPVPAATDACAGTVTGTTSTVFPVTSTTVITWNFDDGNGNVSSSTQNVIIADNVDPVVGTCPSDVTVPAGNAGCTAIVSWTAPTATDNCSSVNTSSTHNPGDAFALGTTAVTYTFTDGAGNTATCSFNVTVTTDLAVTGVTTDEINGNDGTINVTITGGTSPYQPSWSSGQLTDDLTGLNAGNYTITVTDNNGCTATASFTVNSQMGIEDPGGEHIRIYPNPTDGFVQIVSETAEIKVFNLHNSLGQVIQNGKFGKTLVLDLTTQAPGIYYLKINERTFKIVKK